MTRSLDGIRVLDLSRFIAGPYCAMQLGDMGADVVKVERKGVGEDPRSIEPKIAGESLYVMMFNRNKRGMELEFRHPEAPALLKRLAAEADILVENFRPGTMEAMGLGWDVLSAINPRLIMVRISGFGQDGPFARRPCFDVIAQASSGLMDMTGQPDGPPTMAGTFIVDYTTGLHATIGALNALHARQATGRGQVVDVALLDSATSMLMTAIPEYLLMGKETTRHGNRDRYTSPANNFRCADGAWVHISTGNATLFPRFAARTGLLHLLSDPRFATPASRLENADALEAIVAEWTSGVTADEVVAAMEEAEVPCAKVATIKDVVANPQLRHRNQIVEVEHPKAGRIPMQGVTVKLSDTPGDIRHAPPMLGQHTAEVLQDWLTASAQDVELLRSRGIC